MASGDQFNPPAPAHTFAESTHHVILHFQQARDQLSRTATQIGHCSAVLDCALQQADSL
jgi:hypothetical protein